MLATTAKILTRMPSTIVGCAWGGTYNEFNDYENVVNDLDEIN
jgi:hypothetical protein